MKTTRLEDLVRASAQRTPSRIAVEDPVRSARINYDELDRASGEVRAELLGLGVQPGDRVGILGKSIGVVASIFGALKARAAYVPVDASAPVSRGAGILTDCGVRVVILPDALVEAYTSTFGRADAVHRLSSLDEYGQALSAIAGPADSMENPVGDGLAYILYTSGSTGRPKGVMHTHASAASFIDWCSEVFEPTPDDRFSSHAPFHFDLSILDLYVPLKHGAAIVLIDAELGKQPSGLAQVIADREITVWYSTPSILNLLVEYGKLDRHGYPALRTVLFAGEVFALPAFRRLKQHWPDPRYFNLYGPTETNVCTYYAVPEEVAPDRTEPFPIGVACSGDEAQVLDEHGVEVPRGERGELCVRGGSVMVGYWGNREKTAASFHGDPGSGWYRTGDVVAQSDDGYVFSGRRDRMIKRRGYRIEPGEIEAVLHRHPEIVEAAVVAKASEDGAVQITAFVSCRDGQKLPLIAFKRWCSENLPGYMIPDGFSFHPELPKTSTDKIDYQTLESLL